MNPASTSVRDTSDALVQVAPSPVSTSPSWAKIACVLAVAVGLGVGVALAVH